jgi:hypothetical protein
MQKALLIGINYVGTWQALRGCINDVNNMDVLLKEKGFDEIRLLLEKDATTDGIKAAMEWLISGVTAGDTIVMHYSGHGSQMTSNSEPDGYEEIICPIDLDWMKKVITDKDLAAVFNRVPAGVNTTVILDCCHSGTGLNQNESYSTTAKDVTGDVARPATSKFMAPPAGLVTATRVVDWHASRDINSGALLIACSRANQTSADALIDGVPQGAGTASLIRAVKGNQDITYRQLLDSMTDYMVQNGYTQRPQLDGSSALYDKKFLAPFMNAVEPGRVPVPVVSAASKQENKKKISPAMIAVAAVIIPVLWFVLVL